MRSRLDYFVQNHDVSSHRLMGKNAGTPKAALIPVGLADRIYGRRVLVVVDAAGMVEPFSGGGIEYAMRGGLLAGKTAIEALKQGRFDERYLSRFQKVWKKSGDFRILNWMQRS